MDDKFCPNCGAYVRPGTSRCPDCRTKVTAKNALFIPSSFQETKKAKKPPLWLIVLLSIAGMLVLILAVYTLLNRSMAQPAQQPAVTMTEPTPPPAEVQETVPKEETILELYPGGDPAFEDFDWYYNEVLQYGIPDGALMMEPKDLNGPWKYLFRFEVPGEEPASMEQIGYMSISQYGNKIDMSPWPTLFRYANGSVEQEDPEAVGYEPFTGTIDEAGARLSGNGWPLTLSNYYQYQNVQYAIGSLVTTEGYITDVLLVRP